MFRSGYTGNQKTSSWAASTSFWNVGAIVSQTREITLKSKNFTFGDLIKIFVLFAIYNSYLPNTHIKNNITKKNKHLNQLLIYKGSNISK